MSIISRSVDHSLDGQAFESLLVRDDAQKGKRPTVLVCHAWDGRSEDQERFAERLTAWNYTAVAVDLFGKGKHGKTTEECQALMTPLVQDRALLRRRLLAVMDVVQGLSEVDTANIAAIGFCFGGLCVLDLARAGAKVKAVASFHGLFTPPNLPTTKPLTARIAAFHGWEDPFAPPDQVVAFGKEFTEAGADWQLHAYGGTKHAFMNEGAHNPQLGLLYNATTADRAWKTLQMLLAEAFSS